MRNDLQAAVEYFEMVEHNNGPDAMVHFGPVARMEMLRQYKLARTALTALRDMLKRQEGCWHCHGIEAHEIEYVTELKNAYLEHIKAPEAIPYRHCANCGRELSGNAERG